MRDLAGRVLRVGGVLGWLLAVAGMIWFGPRTWQTWREAGDPAGLFLHGTILSISWLPLASSLWLAGVLLRTPRRPLGRVVAWSMRGLAAGSGIASIGIIKTGLSAGGAEIVGQTLLLSLPLAVLTILLVLVTLPVSADPWGK